MTSLEESQQFTPDLTSMLNLVKLTQHLTQDLNAISIELPDGLRPLRQWLNRLQIRNATLAHFICRIIPAQCPFANELDLFGLLVRIPPL